MTANAFDIAADLWRTRTRRASYVANPAAWAEDRLKAFLWSKQLEICNSVVANRRTLVKSGHGIGKSWTTGMLATWWIDTHPVGEAIVVTTAPTYDQVHAILWEEIRKQHDRGQLVGDVLQNDRWTVGGTLVGMGRKPSDYNQSAFQGIHRRYVLVIIDEACGVADHLWTAVEAITTNDDCRIVAVGNPDNPATEFGRNSKPGSGWNVITVSSYDSPNLTGEPVPDEVRPLLVSEDWITTRLKKWGRDSPLFKSKVLGEFPESAEDTLIPLSWVLAAQERTVEPRATAESKLGVDVARFGSDRSVIYHNHGGRIRLRSDKHGEPTTQTTGRAIDQWRETRAQAIQVDGVGVGAGVVDMLEEQGYPVVDMQAGGAPNDPKLFVNARAEWYWTLRTLLDPDQPGEIDLDPEDDELAAQLSSIKYTYTRRGQILIESKDDMRKRGMPSPDRADGCMLSVAEPILSGVSDDVGSL